MSPCGKQELDFFLTMDAFISLAAGCLPVYWLLWIWDLLKGKRCIRGDDSPVKDVCAVSRLHLSSTPTPPPSQCFACSVSCCSQPWGWYFTVRGAQHDASLCLSLLPWHPVSSSPWCSRHPPAKKQTVSLNKLLPPIHEYEPIQEHRLCRRSAGVCQGLKQTAQFPLRQSVSACELLMEV